MEIRENYRNLPMIAQNQYSCIFRDGSGQEEEKPLLVEHEVTVYLENTQEMEFVCSPQYLAELVLGHLYTEGYISGIGNIECISISEDGRTAEVALNGYSSYEIQQEKKCPNRIIKRQMEPVRQIQWEKDWIFQLADRFAEGMPLHGQTWATHSCFLARKGQILFECEDIGRHNAFDKAVGYALRNAIDLTECILYTSGRMPVDMVKKAIMVGIPVLAAKAVPTSESVRIAEAYGLTLIGAARRDQMRIFTNRR